MDINEKTINKNFNVAGSKNNPNIVILGNYIKISDLFHFYDEPSKKKELFTMVNKIKIKPGKYNILFHSLSNHPKYNLKRVSKMGDRLMSVMLRNIDYYEKIGKHATSLKFNKCCNVAVDAGAIVMMDSKYSQNIPKPPYFSKNGIVVPSGLGDGMYDIYTHKYKGNVVFVLVNFYGTYAKSSLGITEPYLKNIISLKTKKSSKKASRKSRKSSKKATKRASIKTRTSIKSSKKASRKSTKRKSSKKASRKPSIKKSTRKSPTSSATLYKVGTKKTGNDGNTWIIATDKNGVKRWKLFRKSSRR